MSIIITDTAPSLIDLLDAFATVYVKQLQLSVTVRRDCWGATLRMVDLTNAMRRGAVCPALSIEFANHEHSDGVGLRNLSDFLNLAGGDYRKCFAALAALTWVEGSYGYPTIAALGGVVSRLDAKGVRVFSPFAKVSPLKAEPAKWTLELAIRALMNGQFEDLRCRGEYTDDYAGDDARNYGRGAITNVAAFVRKLVESPSGWWVHKHDGAVSVNCHSFNCNSFRFALTPATPAPGQAETGTADVGAPAATAS